MPEILPNYGKWAIASPTWQPCCLKFVLYKSKNGMFLTSSTNLFTAASIPSTMYTPGSANILSTARPTAPASPKAFK